MKKIPCKRCNKEVEPTLTEQPFSGGVHIRADFPLCGRWIKWVSAQNVQISTDFKRPTLESIQNLERIKDENFKYSKVPPEKLVIK